MTRLSTKFKLLSCLFFTGALQLSAQFTNVAGTAGLTMVHDGESINEFMDVGSGAAWLDYNQDGHQDIYITMRDGANYLYENNGDGTFTDVANTLNAEDASGDGAGVAVADFNNDGWPDIYLANGDEDVLLRNNGGTSFTDITLSAGLDATGTRRGTSASWGDYNDDGFLDLYVTHHRPVGTAGYPDSDVQDFLFYNNGDETFTNVSGLFSSSDLEGHGFIGGWTDYDNDGDLDLIVVNDCLQNGVEAVTETTKIFRNDGGTNPVSNWTFTEVAHSIGVIDVENPAIADCRNGMGIAVGDYNRDGWMDFYYTNIGHVVLFKNDGDGTFTDVSTVAGVETQASHYFSWGASFVDYDLDGYQDIVTAIGTLDNDTIVNPQNNMLFKNNGDDTFTDVGPSLGMDDINKTRHIVYADYDNDGDPDFLVMSYGEVPKLKRNDSSGSNHYLIVDLQGVDSNRDGIGAKLKLTLPDGTVQYFETRSGSNLGGGDALEAYFGLGSNDSATELEITWPAGGVQVLNNFNIDQTITVSEDAMLPVELTSFDATLIKEEVLLEWATASETDNAYFAIERSSDGRNFEKIGQVRGQGTYEGATNYEFVDVRPQNGENYYRIKQVDFDGTTDHSEVRIIKFSSTRINVSIAPNPVNKNTFSLTYTGEAAIADFEIFDLFGKLVFAGTIDNQQTKEINVTDLPNGMYILSMSGLQDHYSTKMIINK